MKKLLALLLLVSPVQAAYDPCSTSSIVGALIPGAHWTMTNNDLTTFQFVDVSTFTVPSQAAVNAQMAICQANQSNFGAYQVELATTTQALITLYPNLVAPTALQQQQAMRMVARINVLKSLLGQ